MVRLDVDRPQAVATVLALAFTVASACGSGGASGHVEDQVPASIAIVTGDGQKGMTGTELPVALSVRVVDAGARPVSDAAVTWAVTAGGGTVAASATRTDAAGIASTRWKLGPSAGIHRATATAASNLAVTFEAQATSAGVVARVDVTSPASQLYEGDTAQLSAIARDASGNVLQGRTATWSSSDLQVFPVSETGVLRTWGTGPVLVSAVVDGVSGSASLSVVPMDVAITVGAKEVVFDYTTDRCEDYDLPDGAARFVRAEDGSLVLFDGDDPHYYLSRGSDFSAISRDCSQPALVSADLRTPGSYENREWLWSVYREGNRWHALIHNEFHDPVASTCRPGDTSAANPCWYNSVTYAVSSDGGRSFSKPSPPAHVVAPAPYAWVPPAPGIPVGNGFAEGYFNPSNIVRGQDGYYYSFLMAIPTKNWTAQQGLCVLRTNTLDDPTSWRAWDGSGFNLRMVSPYAIGAPAQVCTFLTTSMSAGQVVYDTYLERYLYVAASQGGQPCGISFALSPDLIHWSKERVLVEARLPWCSPETQGPGMLEPVTVLYPSIVDHSDTTANFERAGQTPHLYYTRFNDNGLDRDLVRAQLTITRRN